MLNSSANDQNPSLSDDGLLLFFASDREGGNEDIYVAVRTNRSGSFSRPIRVPGLASPGKDSAPFISPDGRTIYFTSDRPGGRGGLDIWTATRNNLLAGFDDPTPVPGVSSAAHDEDPSLSRDGRELFFTSNRAGKDVLLYRAVRCP
jgi:Tol biopolymer transport system component